jgi:hypothetical protein
LGISQGDVIAYLATVADLKMDFERANPKRNTSKVQEKPHVESLSNLAP